MESKIRVLIFTLVSALGTWVYAADAIKSECSDPLKFSLLLLTKCEGKPIKAIPSKNKNFEFIYFQKNNGLVEYVRDKKRDNVCSMGPVDKMKTSADQPDCYPCGDGDC